MTDRTCNILFPSTGNAASLPMNIVDRLALQKRLNEIGRNLPKAG
jgi:hypothetical protein